MMAEASPQRNKRGGKPAATIDQHRFPCEQCGAIQTYTPGTSTLTCGHCGFENPIVDKPESIQEYDFRKALRQLGSDEDKAQIFTTQCETCAAEFTLDENAHAGECPFCGTPIVTGTSQARHFQAKSLAPFHISAEQARDRFRKWLKSLWFAPGELKHHAGDDTGLTGVYIPYWTYDSQTETSYRGERGDTYQRPETYTTRVNGRSVRRTRMVTHIRWTRVSGHTRRFFDDVLVGASTSLPRKIADRLKPWKLSELKPFNEKYLSGFKSEVYQIRLDEGFQQAVEIMDKVIRSDVAADIGGNMQRIHHVDTQHSDITFKHMLLPVWSAAFQYRNKTYRFVVNGQTGKVRGERPYSKLRIFLAVVTGMIVVAGVAYGLAESGALEALLQGGYYEVETYPGFRY